MICRVEIEGIDKTGKDTLVGYIDYLSNRTIPVGSRGILSTLAYAELYDRDISSNKINDLLEGNKNTLVVYLTADDKDLDIRYKITNEPKIDIRKNKDVFTKWYNELIRHNVPTMSFNTTYNTPYDIACTVLQKLGYNVYGL